MATSGSKTLQIYTWCSLKFSWEQKSQSVENNSTSISWRLDFITGNGALYVYSKPWEVYIDGQKFTGSSHVLADENSSVAVASGTATIPHNADGSKTFSYSFKMTFNVTLNSGKYMGGFSDSGSSILDPIARASQPSCITWPEHTQNVGYFGDEISIHMNRKSSSFTHTVRYQFGSASGTIATGVGTGTTWVIPNSLMDLIPNSLSGSGTIYVDTYNGSTKIGTKSCGFTASVPDSVKPTCTFTLEDVTGIDDIYGSPVKGLSKVKVVVTGKPAYSSPIVSCSITANGMKYSGFEITTGALLLSGSSRVSATVTDKRGRSGFVYYDMNVQPYTPPAITALDVHRCNSDGTTNDRGEYIKVTFSADVSSMSSKNTAAYKLKYHKSSDSVYTEVALNALANKYSVSDYAYIIAADSNSSYDVEASATDRHSTSSRNTSASTAFTLLNFHHSGNGVGIGQVCEKENTLQIGLDVEFKGGNSIFDLVYPIGSIYLAYNHTNPGTLFPGTTWTRIQDAFPWFTGATGTIGQTGGEKTVTLTTDQLPAHNHGGTYTNAGTARTHAWLASGGSAMGFDSVDTGKGAAHNNMPPYIQISAWRRTA